MKTQFVTQDDILVLCSRLSGSLNSRCFCVFALSGENYIMGDKVLRIILQIHHVTFLWSIGTSGEGLTVCAPSKNEEFPLR